MHWDAIPRMRDAMTVDDLRLITFAEEPAPETPGAED
jgi:hypothetical protein